MKRMSVTALRLESLESRQLLTGNNCAVVDETVEMSSESLIEIQATQRNTLFGVATDLELNQASLTVNGGRSGRPIDVYRFTPDERTPIRIDGGQEANFILSPTGRTQRNLRSTNGVIETELAPVEYLLYVYDANSATRGYQFDVSLPQLETDLEFPEVAYIGSNFDWNLNAVNAPEVWAQGFTGDGALVAVIDTGVDYLHPDLNDNIWRNPGEIPNDGIDNDRNGYVDDIFGWDFAYGDNDPMDRQGHGTHVAGTIAAERNGSGTTGVAYDATVLPVKVLRDNGVGSPNAIAAGIRYAVDAGADVINLSLGGGVTRAMVNALQYAYENDVFVVAASGNDGASQPGAPAIYSSVLTNTISVGAHDRFDGLAGFSNRVGGSDAIQVDAPGASIASTYPGGGYRYLSGTSMAAPHVAGVAALALSANDTLSADALRSLLVEGANQAIGRSDSVGGINASRTVATAVSSLRPELTPTPLNQAPGFSTGFRLREVVATSVSKSDNPAIASAIEDRDERKQRRRFALLANPQVPLSEFANEIDEVDLIAATEEIFADRDVTDL